MNVLRSQNDAMWPSDRTILAAGALGYRHLEVAPG
jgi:hypothetical protein